MTGFRGPCPGYVVLPPGHGKSYYHKKFKGIYEADSLAPYNATKELVELRKRAKQSGDWTEYDKLWSVQVINAMPDDTIVIMVPSREIGELVAKSHVFSGVLEHVAWAENLKGRKGSIKEYAYSWDAARASGAKVYMTNEQLEIALWQSIIQFRSQENDD
jgi:hypothetical protein